MGEVYRARDAKLGRDVALKVVPEAFALDADRMARFQREAKVLASLNHPNIASIYGLEDSGSTHALVMELVEGPTLAGRIKAGAIPIDEALRIAKQICEGLECAHDRGIVHRDLKPANVKVTSDDAVKILDFGLAKALEGDPSSIDVSTSPTLSRMATQAGVLLGTAAYMSPEQAKGKPVDRRADIWAFGCVLYEMLTGRMTFHGESVTDTLAAVIRAEPDWTQLPAAMPIRVRVLLQRCLQKDPKQRLQCVGDARIALEEAIAGTSEPAVAMKISSSHWRQVIPWTLVAVSAAAFVVFAWLHRAQLRPSGPAEAVRLQIPLPVKPPLRLTGLFALSPDGRQLGFVGTSSDGVPRIWIRALSSLAMRPLAGTEGVGSLLIWSPDSRFVAFDSGGKLQKIDTTGGPAQTLCVLTKTGVGGSWNKDGVIIFGQFGGTLMRVSAMGGVATPLTVLDTAHGDVAHTVPSFLPDGRHFLYLRDTGTSGAISVGSLDAKPEEQDSKRISVTEYGAGYTPSDDPNSGQLVFLSRGKLLAQPFDTRGKNLSGNPVQIVEQPIGAFLDSGLFSVSTNGTLAYLSPGNVDSQLTWFDVQGKVVRTVGEPGPYGGVALSPDGARAFVWRNVLPAQNQTLWLVDMSRGTSTRFETDSSEDNQSVVWAPDGKSIIFGSARAGQMMDVYEKQMSGTTDVEALVKSNDWKIPLSWSPDGRFVLYSTVGGETKNDLWVLPLGDHKKPVPFLHTQFDETDGHFSPDGHWIAYASDESGRNEVYVRSFLPDISGDAISDDGNKWSISNSGGRSPVWRADGKELYYIDLDGKLMAVSVDTRPEFHAGVPKALFQAPPKGFDGQWATSLDGKRFLFLVPETQGQEPFTVVLNWQAGLKK
jgi:serine/threonine protein kinase